MKDGESESTFKPWVDTRNEIDPYSIVGACMLLRDDPEDTLHGAILGQPEA